MSSWLLYFSHAAGTSITATPTPVTTNPSTTMPSTTTTSSNTTPYTATPSNGVLGGLGNGTSPSGAGMNTDINDGGFRVPKTSMLFSITATLLISSPMILWH